MNRRDNIVKCPRCGSTRMASILYGMPTFSEELDRQIKNKEVRLGGCCISNMNPQYYCFKCRKGVCSPPVFLNKAGAEEGYREAVTSVCFSYGGYFSGFQKVMIAKDSEHIYVDVFPGLCGPETQFHREMSLSEWQYLLDVLYTKLYLHEWKKQYIDPEIMDGEQWSLDLNLTDGHVRNYSGSNAYPPYWEELKELFRPYFTEAGVTGKL